jgi:hypothetical protein
VLGLRGFDHETAFSLAVAAAFAGLLWVPLYSFPEPCLFGFPFFYWYQLAWEPVTALIAFVNDAIIYIAVISAKTPSDLTVYRTV